MQQVLVGSSNMSRSLLWEVGDERLLIGGVSRGRSVGPVKSCTQVIGLDRASGKSAKSSW